MAADPVDDVAARYRIVAAAFTERARAVPQGAWDAPAPCAGWVARDIVGHLVEWVPAFLASSVVLPTGPPVAEDPVGAWVVLRDALQAVLDDPETARRTFSHERAGTYPLDEAIGMFVLGDVLVHTWDLARATGLDETLDAGEVEAMLAGVEPMGDALEQSGQYGARVEVPPGSSPQDRLLALLGRDPR